MYTTAKHYKHYIQHTTVRTNSTNEEHAMWHGTCHVCPTGATQVTVCHVSISGTFQNDPGLQILAGTHAGHAQTSKYLAKAGLHLAVEIFLTQLVTEGCHGSKIHT